MRQVSSLLVVLSILFWALQSVVGDSTPPPQASRDCLQEWKSARGTHCGDSDSIEWTAVNSCRDPIDVQVCMNNRAREGWQWQCRATSGLKPNEWLDGHAFWTCHSTGKRVSWARKAGDFKTLFPAVPAESPAP